MHYLDLAAGALSTFESDMDALGLLPAWSEPRATSAISDVRAFIGRVLASGHAYHVDGRVYFDVSSAPGFGSLSGWDRATMLTAALERGSRPDDPAKRDPLDFVLWERSGPGEPAWPARWGPGRPGWHVECAALAVRELGTGIDLHGGGLDLVFPHHECEAAQAEAATGEEFVRHWMHTAMVQTAGVKMSKSAGNLTFVSDLRLRFPPAVIRLALVGHHYRTPWDWSGTLLEAASDRLERWQRAGRGDGALAAVRSALDDDLSTPDAIAAIDDSADRGEGVSEAAALLGVDVLGADATGGPRRPAIADTDLSTHYRPGPWTGTGRTRRLICWCGERRTRERGGQRSRR